MGYDFFEESSRRSDHDCNKCKSGKGSSHSGLLNDLAVDQLPATSEDPRPKVSNKFAELTVNVQDPCARVVLDGTVTWKPEGISLLESILGIINAGIIFGIPAVIRVWKKNDSGRKVIGESRDASQLLSAIGDLLNTTPDDEINFVDFAFATTPIHAVDANPSCGKNRYFLTIDLDTSVIPGSFLTNILGITNTPPQLTKDDVRNFTFSALEIGENNDKSCSSCDC